MNKWIIPLFILIIGFGTYLIAPAFITTEIDEASPVGDAFDTMNKEQMEEFVAETDKVKNDVKEMNEEMESADILKESDFLPRAHEVQGKAILIEDGDMKILRFENFETINGPQLHIYLASDLSDDDFVDIGPIKGTKGNINYDVSGVDLEKYNHVLVWCKPFRVLFSYAVL